MSSEMIVKDVPMSLGDIRRAIPARLFQKSELRFLVSVGYSVSFTLILMYLAKIFIPLNWWMLPVWVLYAAVTGTVATGVWVLGHECGHGSFSDYAWANDTLGYILHTTLMVPYFSWQHSHAIHHSKTNHIDEGETHVPQKADSKGGKRNLLFREFLGFFIIVFIQGDDSFSLFMTFNYAVIGWPIYLLLGVSGGPARGFTSHFIVPNKLFPPKQLLKVNLSTFGMCTMIYFLYLWAQATSFVEVVGVYVGPYMVTNAWLTCITLLQHTDIDVPHYDATSWTWLKGALATVDRNYPPFIDELHHYIGTTHVLHHIFSDLPHYNSKEANVYMKQIIGDYHKEDSKNVLLSLHGASKLAVATHEGEGVWRLS